MQNIGFYLAPETTDKMLFNLLLKMLEKNNKILIFCESDEQLKQLDDSLWLLGRIKFLPHGKQGDGYESKQPVFLTTKEENPNNSNFIFIFGNPSKEFIAKFDKGFHIFTRKDYIPAKEKWEKLKGQGFDVVYNAMEDNKWVAKGELAI
jgi:DNA polymerase-3 subunit chi